MERNSPSIFNSPPEFDLYAAGGRIYYVTGVAPPPPSSDILEIGQIGINIPAASLAHPTVSAASPSDHQNDLARSSSPLSSPSQSSQSSHSTTSTYYDENKTYDLMYFIDEDEDEYIEVDNLSLVTTSTISNNQQSIAVQPDESVEVIEVSDSEAGEDDDDDDDAVDANFIMPDFKCSICWKCYLPRKPRQLYCGHSFCKKCITEWAKVQVKCPMCRQFTAKKCMFTKSIY